MKRRLLIVLFPFFFSLFLFLFPSFSFAQNAVSLSLFWGDGCPHCAKEEQFLEKLTKKYPDLTISRFEVWKDSGNRKILEAVAKRLDTSAAGVPFTVVGEKYVVGYFDDDSTGREIENLVIQCQITPCQNVVSQIQVIKQESTETSGSDAETIRVPLLGSIKVRDMSLPFLTLVIAGLDGFNPCAMWVLVFLISLLIGMHNVVRRWILGFAFIGASGFVYFLFLSAWLNFFLFIGFVGWVRVIIALVALSAAFYNLRTYLTKTDAQCKVTGGGKRQKIFTQLRAITARKEFIFALVGVVLLAFAVNLVELVCSAGLPAIYTHVLALSKLPTWQYYLYLLFYIFIFMLDDILVFMVAMVTLQVTGLHHKYTRFSHLIGGIIMAILGLLLLFKPELLMFG